MMDAKDLLDRGDLGAAIQELNQAVRAHPTDTHLRVFLFEALCFAGDYERAGRQLDVLATSITDPVAGLALDVYRQLLVAEQTREQVFAGRALPKFLMTPPPAVETYAVLLARFASAEEGLAADYAAAEEATAPRGGRTDTQAFADFRDADDRIAPVLEAFHGSSYVWLPFEQIQHVQISAPKVFRDLLWLPAVVELAGQPAGDVFIPAWYVKSRTHSNNQVKLGRMTEWTAVEDQIVIGVGQRVFLADGSERALLEVRDLAFGPSAPATIPA
jgi:type VI secretion system protein ImpE